MTQELTIPEKFPFFDGHFPGNPVLPGILVVEMTCDFLREKERSLAGRPLTEIVNAKFSRAVTAGMKIVLCAEQDADIWNVRWTEAGSGQEVASLCLAFGSPREIAD